MKRPRPRGPRAAWVPVTGNQAKPANDDFRPYQTQAERAEMMALFDALESENLRWFVASRRNYIDAYGLRAIHTALRTGLTVEWVKRTLMSTERGGCNPVHVGAKATVLYPQPFEEPKTARERLMARRRVARLRLPPPNPVREVKHVASGVICL